MLAKDLTRACAATVGRSGYAIGRATGDPTPHAVESALGDGGLIPWGTRERLARIRQ